MKTSLLLLLPVLAVAAGAVAWKSAPDQVPSAFAFESVDLHVEVDAQTGAAELVLHLEANEALASVELVDFAGATALSFACSPALRAGLDEVELESALASLPELYARFPAGPYTVRARTLRGRLASVTVDLAHEVPARFNVVVPLPDEVLARDLARIAWTRSEGATSYVLEIERADARASFELVLPADASEFVVPAAFLEPGQTYDYSLTAKGDTDNETELEGSFRAGR